MVKYVQQGNENFPLQKCASQERNAEVTDVLFIGAIDTETAQHASLQKEAAVNCDWYWLFLTTQYF